MNKPTLTYRDFMTRWHTTILPKKDNYIREGQAFMNYLGEVWIDEYKRISSVHYYDRTDIDCFFNDQLIPNTINHLEKAWDNG